VGSCSLLDRVDRMRSWTRSVTGEACFWPEAGAQNAHWPYLLTSNPPSGAGGSNNEEICANASGVNVSPPDVRHCAARCAEGTLLLRNRRNEGHGSRRTARSTFGTMPARTSYSQGNPARRRSLHAADRGQSAPPLSAAAAQTACSPRRSASGPQRAGPTRHPRKSALRTHRRQHSAPTCSSLLPACRRTYEDRGRRKRNRTLEA
jgi:hypothetical protein